MSAVADLNSVGVNGFRLDESEPIDDSTEWEMPTPFGEYDVPAFPDIEAPTLMAFARAVATATQTPVDAAALFGLSAVAAAVGTKARIEARTGWSEPFCVFVAVALPPGNRKSAVFSEVIAPLGAWERREAERLAPAIAAQKSKRAVLEARHEKLVKDAAKADDMAQRGELQSQAEQVAAELALTPLIGAPQITADDATPEALAALMAMNQGSVAVMSAEGAGPFALMAGRYDKNGAPNFELYLKGHAGDAVKVNRRNAEPINLPRPALTMAIAVQPDVLRAMADIPGARARGLAARFLYSLPASTVGYRDCNPPPVSDSVRRSWNTALEALLNLEHRQDGEPHVVRLSAAADAILLAYQQELEPTMRSTGALCAIADWAGKAAGLAVRLAGLIHAVKYADKMAATLVDAGTMKAGVDVARYATAHAIAAYGEMGQDPANADARWLLEYLSRWGRSSFSARDLFSSLPRGRFKKADDLRGALAVLEDRGFVRARVSMERLGPGRPRSPVYDVHPSLLSAASADSARGDQHRREAFT